MSVPKKWHVGRSANQDFINAVREVLGLDPLFDHEVPEVERFYQPERSWKHRLDGMTPRSSTTQPSSGGDRH